MSCTDNQFDPVTYTLHITKQIINFTATPFDAENEIWGLLLKYNFYPE